LTAKTHLATQYCRGLGVAISDPENTSNYGVFGTSDKPFAPDAWQSQNGWDARSVVRPRDRTLPERKGTWFILCEAPFGPLKAK